jgi:hypothetical protein
VHATLLSLCTIHTQRCRSAIMLANGVSQLLPSSAAWSPHHCFQKRNELSTCRLSLEYRHRNKALEAVPEGREDVYKPGGLHLCVDERPGTPRQT